MNTNPNEFLETLDDEMNQLMQEHDDIYDSFGRNYKEEVELHIQYESCQNIGNALVDSLIETALLHRKMMIEIGTTIKKYIFNGDYDKAKSLLNRTSELIKHVEANSVAAKIQTEMKKLLEG